MEIKELHRRTTTKLAPEKYEELVKKMRRDHEKPVKGLFEFTDANGGWFDFSFRFFKGDPISTIRLLHGEICELPMGLVKHINNTKRKVRKFAVEAPAKGKLPSTYEVTSRIKFTPLDVI